MCSVFATFVPLFRYSLNSSIVSSLSKPGIATEICSPVTSFTKTVFSYLIVFSGNCLAILSPITYSFNIAPPETFVPILQLLINVPLIFPISSACPLLPGFILLVIAPPILPIKLPVILPIWYVLSIAPVFSVVVLPIKLPVMSPTVEEYPLKITLPLAVVFPMKLPRILPMLLPDSFLIAPEFEIKLPVIFSIRDLL